MNQSNGGEIERLIGVMAKLPGLGPRSARRAVLYLIRHREKVLQPLTAALTAVSEHIKPCSRCGNIDSADPCRICTDPKRDDAILCVVEDVADLWALERGGIFKGRYHVLGGTLSALDGVTPEDLRIGALLVRIAEGTIQEVILATNATVDGQTTAHYIADQLSGQNLKVTSLAQGVPLGGELDYLDDGTLAAAFSARKLMD